MPADGREAAVGRTVLSTYQNWWAAQVKAYAGADPDGAQVAAYSSGTALSGVLLSLRALHAAKLVMTGQPSLDPVVQSLNLGGATPSVVISDCVDVTGWHQTDPSNGSYHDAPQHLTRYPATAVMRTNGVIWKVFEFNREAGRTC
ncbi:hypothetical protein [Kitasatospora viridis]|uniref:hypothetical protein n=1 Tax=Kitasatospora viridis TaxID=281105 RepID=UPI00119E11E3|nr:hypothetical protein [Kitasatospora viridis]